MSILSVTEIVKPNLDQMAAMYARHYTSYKKLFIGCFIKFKSYRMALAFTVQNFEINVVPYKSDHKIDKFVDELNIKDSQLLKRVLVMIKLITN